MTSDHGWFCCLSKLCVNTFITFFCFKMYCTNDNFIKNKWLYFCIGGKKIAVNLDPLYLCRVTVNILKQELQ